MICSQGLVQQYQQTEEIPNHLLNLARLHSTVRHRRIEHLSFLETNTIEFPPIASITLAFPTPQSLPQRVEIKNSPRRKKMTELKSYIEQHGERVSLDANIRYVAPNPQNNRMMLFQKTVKGSQCSSLGHKQSKDHTYQPPNLPSVRLRQQSEGFQEFKSKLFAEITAKAVRTDTRNCSFSLSSPPVPSFISPRPVIKNQRKVRLKGVQLQRAERYSPWRSEELQEELVL